MNVISRVKYVLYFHISTLRTMCAVHNMAVFCISLISCFPVVLLRYCLTDCETVPVAPAITGINFVPHITFILNVFSPISYQVAVFR